MPEHRGRRETRVRLLDLMQDVCRLAGSPDLDPCCRASLRSDIGRARFDTLSFFLVAFLASAAAFRAVWNAVRRDWAVLPKLTFGRAVAVVSVWAALFVLVLTMVPMVLARRDRAYRIAAVCAGASVLGGVLGYAIGYFLYDSVGQWLMRAYGMERGIEEFR